MNQKGASIIKRGRLMYIFQAALEYLVSILVTGSFLATLTKELGFSDSLTGILSSVISLGCFFQLFSLTINKRRSKGLVIALSLTNQIMFMLLFVVPLTNFKSNIKTVLFIALIFLAYVIYNAIHPKKINWLMSLVDDSKRGIFTANKEIVSLLAGMVFSFLMGTLVDHFKESGNIRLAFIISAAVMFFLTLLHTLTLVLTVEKPMSNFDFKGLKETVKELLHDKSVLSVTMVFVLYNMAYFASIPFYGTYQINELGFNLKFVSLLVIFSSVIRILVSKFWGRYADKHSFAKMIEKCFLCMAISFLCVIFSSPSNAKWVFTLYYVFNGIAMGGINSALINLIFDFTTYENRANALGITQAVAGIVGFLTTLLVSPLVSVIQEGGMKVLGINVYAQQVVTMISFIIIILAYFYVKIVLKKSN